MPVMVTCTFPPSLDHDIRELASRQGGFVREDQVVALGATPGYVRGRLRRGMFVRSRPHVLQVGARAGSLEELAWEPVLSVGGDTAITGSLGLSLDGIRVRGVRPRLLAITSSHVDRGRARDVIQSTTFAGEPIHFVRGLPVTSIERSILEVGVAVRDKWTVVNACHQAAYRDMLDLHHMHEVMDRSTRRHGLTSVRDGVELYEHGGAVTASDLERRFAVFLVEIGVPRAMLNTLVTVDGISFPVDAHWAALGACIEVDGPPHARPTCRVDDTTRGKLLDRAGIRYLRVDGADLSLRRRELAEAVWSFLASAADRIRVDLYSLERW